jgi:hypothetical protein
LRDYSIEVYAKQVGVTSPAPGQWCTPVVPKKKKNKSARLAAAQREKLPIAPKDVI